MESKWSVVISIPQDRCLEDTDLYPTQEQRDKAYRSLCEDLRRDILRHCDIPNLGWTANPEHWIEIVEATDAHAD